MNNCNHKLTKKQGDLTWDHCKLKDCTCVSLFCIDKGYTLEDAAMINHLYLMRFDRMERRSHE